MRWPWGSEFNTGQRKETAKVILAICQTITLALLATPFVPEIKKRLSFDDTIYGVALVVALYFIAMRLLKEVD